MPKKLKEDGLTDLEMTDGEDDDEPDVTARRLKGKEKLTQEVQAAHGRG